MLQTLMVFPNNNSGDLFNVTHTQLENMAKLFQQQGQQQSPPQNQSHHQAGGMMASATSPIQGYILDTSSTSSSSSSSSYINPSQPPSLHQPSQQHQPQQPPQQPSPQQPHRPRPHPQSSSHSQHTPYPHPQQPSQVSLSPQQQNMHYPIVVSPMLVGNISAPSSPSYSMIKSEEHFHQPNMDYTSLVYHPPFDMHSPPTPQQTHILPSQRPHQGLSSPQQRMMSYGDVPLMSHRQTSQPLRMHHQPYHSSSHHHVMYDPVVASAPSTQGGRPSISSAMSMSMPLSVSIPAVTSGSSALMMNSPSSANSATSHHLFTPPTSASTTLPFFQTSPSSTPGLTKDEIASHKMSTAAMMVSFHPKRPQGHGSMTAGAEPGFANPVSPKRPRPDPGYHHQHHQPHHHHPLSLAAAQLSPELIEATALAPEFHGALSSPHNTIATAVAVAPGDMTTTTTTAVVTSAKRSRRSSAVSTSRTCSTELYAPSDDLNEIRLTKVAKTTVSSSAAASASAMSTGRPSTTAAAAELSRIAGRTGKSIALSPPFVTQTRSQQGMTQPLSPPLQSIEPTTTTAAIDYTQRATAATTSAANNNSKARANVTHPRRAAQNRAAQRTFRNRRKAYIKDMEQKVLELHQTRARFDMLKNENQEIWRRYRILENLVISSSNGNNNNRQLDMPSFTPMTPFLETEAGLAAQAAQAAHAAQVAQAAAQAQATGAAMAGGRGGALNDAQYSSQSSELDDEGEGSPVPRSYQQPQRQ